MKAVKKFHLFLFGLFTYFPVYSGISASPLTFNQRVIQIREALQKPQIPTMDKTLIDFFQINQVPVDKRVKDWNNWDNWGNFDNWLNWFDWGNY